MSKKRMWDANEEERRDMEKMDIPGFRPEFVNIVKSSYRDEGDDKKLIMIAKDMVRVYPCERGSFIMEGFVVKDEFNGNVKSRISIMDLHPAKFMKSSSPQISSSLIDYDAYIGVYPVEIYISVAGTEYGTVELISFAVPGKDGENEE